MRARFLSTALVIVLGVNLGAWALSSSARSSGAFIPVTRSGIISVSETAGVAAPFSDASTTAATSSSATSTAQ